MATTERIKEEYLKHTRKLFHDFPEALLSFEQLWQAGKVREAYLCADEAIRREGIVLSPEHRKADEAFYWEIVN